jgi:hypothetical protein
MKGILKELSPRDAQLYGNRGYTVVGAYKNPLMDGAPHYATVRPGYDFNESNGPIVANVGSYLGIFRARDRMAFGEEFYKKTRWYYNPNKEFCLDLAYINSLKGKII